MLKDLQLQLQDPFTAAKLHKPLSLRTRQTFLAVSVHVIDAHLGPQTRIADSEVFGDLAHRVVLNYHIQCTTLELQRFCSGHNGLLPAETSSKLGV